MSCQLKCDSLHFTRACSSTPSLSPSLSLSLSSLPIPRLWPVFRLFINHIFVSGNSFPTFTSPSFMSFCLLIWLPDTRPWQPVIRFVLWCPRGISEEGWNTEQVVNTCFHLCCFDKVQFVHIKASFSLLSGPLCSPS